MKDLELRLPDRPGSLAAMATALGEAGVSVEGGGVFVAGGAGVAHFLIADHQAETARTALQAAAIDLVAIRDVTLARLRQDVPGQLGALCGRLAAAGVNITTQYSDHAGQLVLVVDDPDLAARAVQEWTRASTQAG